MLAKDRFVRQAELRITNSKRGLVKVNVGYHSAASMKDDLKWPELLNCILGSKHQHYKKSTKEKQRNRIAS